MSKQRKQPECLTYAQRVAVAEAEIPALKVREGDREVTVSAVACRAVLKALASFGPAGGELWPSRQSIARKSGLSVRTVQRALDALVRAGILERRYFHAFNRRLAKYRIRYSRLKEWVNSEIIERLKAGYEAGLTVRQLMRRLRLPPRARHGTQGTNYSRVVSTSGVYTGGMSRNLTAQLAVAVGEAAVQRQLSSVRNTPNQVARRKQELREKLRLIKRAGLDA
ncbi:MAG: helix-turn-helix domain-containing protein [Bacteroidetes bacterium]|nr:MAG: helix-turn-helix domain-containing protein [Bacteroidota bacterium]